MAPLIVQIVSTILARLVVSWRNAARVGLAAMFVFTAGSHFSSLSHDLAAMIPPPLTGALWVIYLTGALEAAGAAGLVTQRWRLAAGWCLVALLVALFPANVYASITGATLNGAAATPLWLRAPLQAFWIWALWWSTLSRGAQTVRQSRAPSALISVSAKMDVAPKHVYDVIADYRHGHPHILPKGISDLVVEAGGVGAGTQIRFRMRTFGVTRTARATVSEPEPGRVLVEYLIGGPSIATTFTVEPAGDGNHAAVTIATRLEVLPGVLGALQRIAATRALAPMYREELARLAAYATRTVGTRAMSGVVE